MITQPISTPPLCEPVELAHTRLTVATPSRLHVSVLTVIQMALRTVCLSQLCMSAIPFGVGLILSRRTPVQIAQMIVLPVIITMQSPHSQGTFSDKSCQDKAMDRQRCTLPVTTQNYLPVRTSQSAISSPFARFSLSQYPAFNRAARIPPVRRCQTVQRSYSTMVRNFIARKARHRQPSFSVIHGNELTRLRRAAAP